MRRLARSVRTALRALACLITLAGPAAAEELDLFAWSEYVPQAVLDGFTEETQIRVNYETYASNEEMLAKLVSGAATYDLVQPSEYVVEALVKEQKLAPLDHVKLPNLKNIGREYWGRPHDPTLTFSVPYMQGTVGIVVDTAKVKGPITGYNDVFQEKHRRRIVILDDALVGRFGAGNMPFAVAPDGRILAVREDDSVKPDHIVVLRNWRASTNAPR